MEISKYVERVNISILAEKKCLTFDDYFYSKHPLKIVRQYLSNVGVWEKDIWIL